MIEPLWHMHLFLRSFSFELFLSETLSLSHLWLTIWESAFLGEMDGALKRVTFPLMFNFGEDWYLLDNGEETNFYTISFSPFFVLILHFLILPSFGLPISKLSENTKKKQFILTITVALRQVTSYLFFLSLFVFLPFWCLLRKNNKKYNFF